MINYGNLKDVKSFNIKVKRYSEVNKFEILPNGDWTDLAVIEDISFTQSGQFRLLSFGFALQLPEGYEAHIVPRSSTFKKFGILQANGMGVIDNSYCGDNDIWMFPAYSTRQSFIAKGERIAQFRIVEKQPVLNFVFVDSLNNQDRGGFGSTG